jgi:hypothetical protein
MTDDLEPYIRPTKYIESDAAPVVELARSSRGTHADLPIDDIRRTLLETYVPMVRASKP